MVFSADEYCEVAIPYLYVADRHLGNTTVYVADDSFYRVGELDGHQIRPEDKRSVVQAHHHDHDRDCGDASVHLKRDTL